MLDFSHAMCFQQTGTGCDGRTSNSGLGSHLLCCVSLQASLWIIKPINSLVYILLYPDTTHQLMIYDDKCYASKENQLNPGEWATAH